MKAFNLWQKWLVGFGFYLIAFGIFIAFFSDTKLFDLIYNNHIDHKFFGENMAQGALHFRLWIYGVLGTVLVGWGILVVFIGLHPFKKKEIWAWYAILISSTLWIIPDMYITIKFNVWINVFSNLILFMLMMAPIIFTYKYFHHKEVS